MKKFFSLLLIASFATTSLVHAGRKRINSHKENISIQELALEAVRKGYMETDRFLHSLTKKEKKELVPAVLFNATQNKGTRELIKQISNGSL